MNKIKDDAGIPKEFRALHGLRHVYASMSTQNIFTTLNGQRRLTGLQAHIFLTKDGARMTPDHFRNVVWIPALEKAGVAYRAPIQTRHSFATMMLSAGEDVGWVQNMLGHSSLQMIFQRYYSFSGIIHGYRRPPGQTPGVSKIYCPE